MGELLGEALPFSNMLEESVTSLLGELAVALFLPLLEGVTTPSGEVLGFFLGDVYSEGRRTMTMQGLRGLLGALLDEEEIGSSDALLGEGEAGGTDPVLGEGKTSSSDTLLGEGETGGTDLLLGEGEIGSTSALLGEGETSGTMSISSSSSSSLIFCILPVLE